MIGRRAIKRPAAVVSLVRIALVLVSSLVPALAVQAAALDAEGGYVREMPPGQTVSAAFMTLKNTTAKPIGLVAATSDAADRAEFHNHRHSGDGMMMEKVIRLEIPAHGTKTLQPGGLHLMLIGLKRPLKAGDTVGITLLDEVGKSYPLNLPVTKLAGAGAAMPMSH